MIYLTKMETTCSETNRVIEGAKYPQRAHVIDKTFRRLKSGTASPAHRLVESILDPIVEHCTSNPVGKTALILAAGSQGWPGVSAKYGYNKECELYYESKVPLVSLTNIYAGRLASQVHAFDYVSTDATACASSLHVLMEMQNLINVYGFDRVVVVAVEDGVTNQSLDMFGEIGASLKLSDPGVPSAFDSTNGGFYVGQGAAIGVFENADSCRVEPVGTFHGAYSSSERNTNALSQCEDGEGFVKAIKGALTVAKVDKSEVNLVKTHGTGTPVNNAAEKTALYECLPEFIATSYKPRIGHTVGVSGLLETGLLFDALKEGYVPEIPNRTETDSVFLSARAPAPDGKFLSLAAGMGNIYSAALFSREV